MIRQGNVQSSRWFLATIVLLPSYLASGDHRSFAILPSNIYVAPLRNVYTYSLARITLRTHIVVFLVACRTQGRIVKSLVDGAHIVSQAAHVHPMTTKKYA